VNSLLKWDLHRDNVAADELLHGFADLFKVPKNVTKMTLKSAFEDLSRTTLEALYGGLRRLEYLAGLRFPKGEYTHWGFSKVYGEQPARKALTSAHRSAVSEVLSTPLRDLLEETQSSCGKEGVSTETFLSQLTEKKTALLPPNPGAGSERHLNSVLRALVGLARNRERNAIHRAS